jgi:hypothetical protein
MEGRMRKRNVNIMNLPRFSVRGLCASIEYDRETLGLLAMTASPWHVDN